MKQKNIAIVAGGFGREQAPLKDKAWECWGLNAIWNDESEGDYARWFELHRRSYLTWEHNGQTGMHFRWLKSLRKLPVYVQEPKDWPELRTAKPFPWKRVAALVPAFARYHACSVDWLLAYAITLKPKNIGLYGVEQWHTVEPISSRACVEFWSGFAIGRGINVQSADGTTFKLAHYVIDDVPYAIDPKWLPFEDRTNGISARARKALAATVDGKVKVLTLGLGQ